MKLMNFLYIIKQRFNYYIAKSDIEKKIAILNKYERQISITKGSFSYKGQIFDIDQHGFVIERFATLKNLLALPNTHFRVDENNNLLFHYQDFVFRVKTSEELFILKEIFVDNCYSFFFPEKKITVIDVGMNVGFASLSFACIANVSSIHAYEPFKETYDDAIFNFNLNKSISHKILPYNLGIGRRTEKLEAFFSSYNKGKNSTSLNSILGEKVQIELVEILGEIDKIIKENSDSEIFIKMDCEGAEHEIFDTFTGLKIPNKIIGFIIEWHRYRPTAIINVLLQNNFKIHCTGISKIGLITAFR